MLYRAANQDIQKIIFLSALNAITSDGDVQPEEILELEDLLNNTSYLRGFDAKNLLVDLINNNDPVYFLQVYFYELEKYHLTLGDKLLIMEVILRIVNSNYNRHPNEIRFIHLVKSKLKLTDLELEMRFGYLEYLSYEILEPFELEQEIFSSLGSNQLKMKELILLLIRD